MHEPVTPTLPNNNTRPPQGRAWTSGPPQLEETRSIKTICISPTPPSSSLLLPLSPYGSFIRSWTGSSQSFSCTSSFMQFSAKGGIFSFFFYIPSSLIVDCHFFPSLNTMRLQSGSAAEAWYCQFLVGPKASWQKHKGGETWSSVGQDEQGRRRRFRTPPPPPLPPIQIHFNGKFVVKCPQQK